MSTRTPQNGSESLPASGRSRGSGTRNRSRTINTLITVFKAVDKLGVNGKEFGTTELSKKAGISTTQAYTWLQALRAHGLVGSRLVRRGRPSGDWRWKRRYRIIKVRSR